MIISPAMMKVFEECQQKYFFTYVEKISLPQNKYLFQKGKNIHAIANYFLKGYSVSKLEEVLTSEEKELWKYLKSSEYFSYKVVESEYSVSSKINDNWVGGRIDALVKEKENYYILDYKTGSIPKNPEYDYQTIVYMLCVDKLIKKYSSLNFVYVDLKNKSEKIITFTENLKEEYEEKIEKVLYDMENLKKSPQKMLKNNKCNCDYYCICERI